MKSGPSSAFRGHFIRVNICPAECVVTVSLHINPVNHGGSIMLWGCYSTAGR